MTTVAMLKMLATAAVLGLISTMLLATFRYLGERRKDGDEHANEELQHHTTPRSAGHSH